MSDNSTYMKVEMHWYFYGECGISISVTKYPDAPGTERMHFHDFYELVVVTEGTGRHVLESRSYPLFKGSVFLIPPGTVHGYDGFRNFELVNVLFFPEQLLFSWEKLLTIPGIPGLLDEPFRLRPRELEEVRPLLLSMRNERREKKPDFVAICYDQLDHTGHADGFDVPEYYTTLERIDTFLGRVIEATKKAGMFDDTIFILTGDHGGKDKGHGGKSLLEMEVPFIIAGKNVRQGGEFKEVNMRFDTAATIAYIFGLEQPQAWIGRPAVHVFK